MAVPDRNLTVPITPPDGFPPDDAPTVFVEWLATQTNPLVVEVGTRQAQPGTPTHHAEWVPEGGQLTMVDAFDGYDVDVVADAETMAPFDDATVDAIICCSTLEHVPRPWRAIEAFARILRPGGTAFVATHQSFPIHGYPSDYFRFSIEAMRLLGTDVGLDTIAASYSYPAVLTPPAEVTRWNPAAPVWLNVSATYRRPEA